MAQNFRYDPEDWYVLTKPGSITAITEDNFNLYFATENGVYRYNKAIEDFQYDYLFSVQLNYPDIRHIYFDSYRDYFWVVHREGISYKSSISSIWREMSLTNSGIFSYYEIDDIGISPEYFWIRSVGELYPFNPFSAVPANMEEAIKEVDFIQWGFSRYGKAGKNLEISRYTIEGDWSIGLRNLTHLDGRTMQATVYMEDNSGNQWFGTDAGYILKGWRHSYRLEMITIGLPFDHITTAYPDKTGDWWFADSYFKRSGQIPGIGGINQSEHYPFLSQWNEVDNQWTYYLPNESIVIENYDVNSILRVGSTMYFGTMYGLLYLDLYTRDWNLINTGNGLNDAAVWDMLDHNGSIYTATARGINEVSIVNHTVIPDRNDKFEFLSTTNIYDLEADSQYLYLAAASGLFRMDWEEGNFHTLSKRELLKIRIEQNSIAGTDGSLWLFQEGQGEEYVSSNVHDFDICDSYIWRTDGYLITLQDTSTSQIWEYNIEDGIPGNTIYGVNCDEDWAWFLTNKGIAFYNWSRYHNKSH